MKLSKSLITALVCQISSSFAMTIQKRDSTTRASTTTLTESIWTTTSSSSTLTLTPIAFDGVTVSASPAVSNTTPWVTLDSSGVPSSVTPTVKGSSTVSASPTPTDDSYPTGYVAALPVVGCFNERATDAFCISNGTEWVLGETYWITWNPLHWSTSSVPSQSKIRIRASEASNDTDAMVTSDWVKAAQSFYALTITSDMIDSSSNGYIQLYLSPFVEDETSDSAVAVSGPIIKLLSSKSDASTSIKRLPSDNTPGSSSSSSSHGKNKASVIAPAVVVPVVVVGLLAGLGVFYFFYRKKKNVGKAESPDGSVRDHVRMESYDTKRSHPEIRRPDNASLKTESINANPFE